MSTDVIFPDTIPATPQPKLGDEVCIDYRGGDYRHQPRRNAGAGQGGDAVLVAPLGEATIEQASTSQRTLAATVADYVQLTKPRIVVMILVTTVASATIAATGLLPAVDLVLLLLGTAAIAASAGAANQIWERLIDARMARTATRPLPGGRVDAASASVFTGVLGIVGLYVLAAKFGTAPALIGAITWLLYVLVYTPLKTRTAWNTTVGAIAGALPILIGYTAAGGGWNDLTGWLLFGVLAAWQYPHFMAIAWMYRRQYGEAGFRMTTTVEPSGRSAGLQSIAGSLALIACGFALVWTAGELAWSLLAASLVIASSVSMLLASFRFTDTPDDRTARKLLRSSLLVLPAVLAIVTIRVFI